MAWTEASKDFVRARYGKPGHSCSTIAADLWLEYGLRVSRNAVIGKATRMGLQGAPRKARATTPRTPRTPRHVLFKVQRSGNIAPRPTMGTPEPAIDIVDMDIPIVQRCALLELSDTKCRWPIGNVGTPEFFFCGGGPAEAHPYCTYHSRVAYQPTRSRADRRPMRR